MALQQLALLLCTGWATYDMVIDVPQNVGNCPLLYRAIAACGQRTEEMTSSCQLCYTNSHLSWQLGCEHRICWALQVFKGNCEVFSQTKVSLITPKYQLQIIHSAILATGIIVRPLCNARKNQITIIFSARVDNVLSLVLIARLSGPQHLDLWQ